jgi:hypothetical protein
VTPVYSSYGWVYYGGAGGGSGAMAVITVNAADITGTIAFTVGSQGGPGSGSGTPGSAGTASTVTFTWKGHTLTVTAGAGFPNQVVVGMPMPGLGGQVSVTYGGSALPPVIGYSGQNGTPSPILQAFGVGGVNAYQSGPGPGGKGWMLSNIPSPTLDGWGNGYGAGGYGGDGVIGAPQSANQGIVAMIS